MSFDIVGIWWRIHEVVDGIHPDTAKSFNPPATALEIEALESLIGVSLPSDFRQSLEFHNGQIDRYGLLGPSADGTMMDTAAIASAWEMLTEIDQQFWKTDPNWGTIEWWNPKWIPIADSRSGDYLCINMDPNLLPVGHLVYHVHDNPFHDTNWPSFGAWLVEIAQKLERGEVERDGGGSRVLYDGESI